MNKSTKRKKLFNMNLALALTRIASGEDFQNLEQKTKNFVSRMLMEIKNVYRHDINLTNKILFDMHYLHKNENLNRISRIQKRVNESPRAVSQASNLTTTSTSSWSSLRSTSNKSRDSTSDSSLSNSADDEIDDAQSFLNEKELLFNIHEKDLTNDSNFIKN